MNNTPNTYALPTSPVTVTGSKWNATNIKVASGGVTVTTIAPPRMQRPLSQGPLTLLNNHIGHVSFHFVYSDLLVVYCDCM